MPDFDAVEAGVDPVWHVLVDILAARMRQDSRSAGPMNSVDGRRNGGPAKRHMCRCIRPMCRSKASPASATLLDSTGTSARWARDSDAPCASRHTACSETPTPRSESSSTISAMRSRRSRRRRAALQSREPPDPPRTRARSSSRRDTPTPQYSEGIRVRTVRQGPGRRGSFRSCHGRSTPRFRRRNAHKVRRCPPANSGRRTGVQFNPSLFRLRHVASHCVQNASGRVRARYRRRLRRVLSRRTRRLRIRPRG